MRFKYKKRMRKNKIFFIILIFIFIILAIFLTRKSTMINNLSLDNNFFKNYSTVVDNVKYSLTIDTNVVYEDSFELQVEINEKDETVKYKIVVLDEGTSNIFESECKNEDNIKVPLNFEGAHNLIISILRNDEEKVKIDRKIYYIKPYKRQFLDELSNKGIQVHYIDGTWEKYDTSIEMINYSGFRNIKSSFLWNSIENHDKYNFNYYDKWINRANELGLNIYGCINRTGTLVGDNKKIDTKEEIEHFNNFIKILLERYPNIKCYDFLNEPNLISSHNSGYINAEDLYWYSMTVKRVQEDNDIDLVPAALANYDSSSASRLSMNEFFTYLYNYGVAGISNEFSYHVYDYTNESVQDVILSKTLKQEKELFNSFGGFIKTNITEYGLSSNNKNKVTEDIQARKLVQQTVTMDKFNINFSNLYAFWNTGNNKDEHEANFGIVNNDYTPKKSYYSLKQLLTNTNGAEYIGTVNLADGLETHVYDKDGKTKIITWSTNTNNTISIPYENFTASDMYGNAIENTDGTLKITSSPVYLDNVSTKYFYEAISNTALQKYAEFEEKFSEELRSIDGLQEQINKLKNYMSSIANNKAETQEKSIEMMHEHFYLGTMILDSFNKDKLNVEYVKVSSMLDMLNDIGNSYEDLLTVSATSREAYYKETEKLLNKAETTINNNSDLNILYPSKILDFAKELHDKSKYIIGLEEENDIKTGLIVSNSLHAYYLADWANDFVNIYVNKYIKENPVTVSYSNTNEFTNKDLTVTLNIGSDSKVINNEGKNTYTFNKNGTFTFEYERRGQAFKQEITITNIDKEAPIISGIVNGKIYTNSVKPVITDKNLAKVEVLFNGISIQFNSGNTLKEEGIYNITATDKAGNSTSIEMYIVEKGKDGYVVDGEHILNVRQETKVEQFAKKFNLSTEYTIKRNNNNLLKTDIIATGDILQLKNGSEYTIIVAGDINRDGKVTTYDLSTFRRYILNLREFDKLEEMAADINVDKQELGVKDYTRMRIEILGEY